MTFEDAQHAKQNTVAIMAAILSHGSDGLTDSSAVFTAAKLYEEVEKELASRALSPTAET